MYRVTIIIIAAIALLTIACGGTKGQQPAAPKPRVFLPAIPSVSLSPQEQREYMRMHYWNRFNFADTLFIRDIDTGQMKQAFANWVALYLFEKPTDRAPMDTLMRRASVSRQMLDYFKMLADDVIHDPNSPLRNDEFYIPVLEAFLASPYYDQYERIGPQYDLHIASQNRVGHRANDFRFTLASGATSTLHSIKADHTLLFISNPGCPMCRQAREEIIASPILSDMIKLGRLKVLVLYPDEDIDEWREYRREIPSAWINAYDDGCVIRANNSYNLTAIPALYLLDRDKIVLIKDSANVPYIEAMISGRQ